MRSLHAGLLAAQGLPVIIGAILAIWIAYYLRAAVVELRAIRANLEWLNDRVEERSGAVSKPEPSPMTDAEIVAKAQA
jgi:hypothetical protein